MFALLRVIIIGILVYLVVKAVRKMLLPGIKRHDHLSPKSRKNDQVTPHDVIDIDPKTGEPINRK